MGYNAISFSAGEQPTTAKWNLLGTNDASFHDATGISNNVIKSTHLGLTAAFDGVNGVQTYTNSASAGGAGSFINLGGIKLCWGTGASITTNNGATAIAINLPASFFTNVLYANVVVVSLATQSSQYANITNYSTSVINGFLVAPGTGSAVPGWFVIGN